MRPRPCPPSKIYRLQKLVRRNKLAFTAGAAIIACILSILFVWYFVHRPVRELMVGTVQLAGGHDSILFADFAGRGYAQDLLVKDRYSNFWVYDKDFELRWEKRACNPGHYPMEYDVNGDGRVELVCGYTLYARDGKVLWSRPELGGHSDAVYVEDMDGDGKAEIAIAASHGETSEQATLLDAEGKVLRHGIKGPDFPTGGMIIGK